MNKVLIFILFIFIATTFAYAEGNKVIAGEIEKIAEDGSYIVVSGQKISTTETFIEDAYFEIGDKVKIEVVTPDDKTSPQAVNYEYDFDVESDEDIN